MTGMQLISSLAWRNLWRNRRRTMVILFAIILGVWAMIVTAAFMRGMSLQMLEKTIENLNGHIQIHHNNYLDDPVVDNSFSINRKLLEVLNNNKNILAWSSRIRVPAVITSEYESYSLELVGIDPVRETNLSFLSNSIVEGNNLSDKSAKGIVVGKEMIKKLGTGINKRVVILSQDRNNVIADRGVRITGVFDTDMDAVEKQFVFVSTAMTSKLLDLGDQVSEIEIRLRDESRLDDVVNQLKHAVPELKVSPWYELQPITKLVVEVYDSFHVIWHVIVFLAMGFGIINTLLMAVFERTREFGLFTALGLQPRFILGQVWLEAVYLLLLGVSVGNLVSWLTVMLTGEGIDVSAFAQGMEMAQMASVIPFVIVKQDLLMANAVVVVLGILTSLYPAWRAAHLVPADAITRV